MPFLVECIQDRIDKATLDSNFVESFNITNTWRSPVSPVDINFILGRILMQDIHPNGFK